MAGKEKRRERDSPEKKRTKEQRRAVGGFSRRI